MRSSILLVAGIVVSVAQAAVSNLQISPTGVPAFKGRSDLPIARVTFVASEEATADTVRLPLEGTDLRDIKALRLGDAEHATLNANMATFTLPVKAGENTVELRVELSDSADIGRCLHIGGQKIRIGSIVTRPAQEIVDRRLADGRVRRSKNFRIPGIVQTPKGTLVAVFDIRYKHGGDLPADITVGVSTSKDGGNTWSPIRTAMDYEGLPGGAGIGDPTILVDPSNGRIWVAALRTPNSGQPIFSSSKGTIDAKACGQVYLAFSDDEGKTWSTPRNITAEIKRLSDPDTKTWGVVFQGPGAGIALKDGTLVFPAQVWGEKGRAPHHGVLIYSKDHGKTWTSSKASPFGGSESTVVQLKDGSLLLNTREGGGPKSRITAITKDLGETWEKVETTPLRQPGNLCQAALLEMGGNLYFSNPNSGKRDTMSLRVSTDEGKTWSEGMVYDPRACAGYSSLCPVGDNAIGILYEGTSDYHYFLRIPLREIK